MPTKTNSFLIRLLLLLLLLTAVAACRDGGNDETPEAEAEETAVAEVEGTAEVSEASATPRPSRTTPAQGSASMTAEAEEAAEESGEDAAEPTRAPRYQARVIFSSINLREGPGTDSSAIAYLDFGEIVTVLEGNRDASWYRVETEDGQRGWVAASVVESVSGDPLLPTATPYPTRELETGEARAEISPSSTNLRLGPGLEYPIMRRLFEGDTVIVIARTGDGDWYKVETNERQVGWLAFSVLHFLNNVSPEDMPITFDYPQPPEE